MEFLEKMGINASNAAQELIKLTKDKRADLLRDCADALCQKADFILEANRQDIDDNPHKNLEDRLMLNRERIEGMACGMRQVADMEDCLDEIISSHTAPNGIVINKVRVPLGVVGIIYEARPNVTADAFALCFKAGNSVILKGGSEALRSNKAIVSVIRECLNKHGITQDAVSLIESTDREVSVAFMKLKTLDVLIPRGGAGLIKSVMENSTVPVIETGVGNCHIYVDEWADMTKGLDILINAKTQRPSVCNSCEKLLIHRNVMITYLPIICEALNAKGVSIRGDWEVINVCGAQNIHIRPITDEDWSTEYGNLTIAIKGVSNIGEAIAHINKYSSKHSEAIITENKANAERFLKEIDSACVYVNASTRFSDGFEFGMGAEIGISTQKLHARGPMGLREITSYKYKVYGDGQVRE